jgi:hypothetical protein
MVPMTDRLSEIERALADDDNIFFDESDIEWLIDEVKRLRGLVCEQPAPYIEERVAQTRPS